MSPEPGQSKLFRLDWFRKSTTTVEKPETSRNFATNFPEENKKCMEKQYHQNLKRKKIEVDEDAKHAIKKTSTFFFVKNGLPTLQKVVSAVRENDMIPKIGKETLRNILYGMNFTYAKIDRNSIFIKKHEIILRKREYLRKIKEFRKQGNKMYYTDETWVNEEHTVKKVCQDENVKNSQQAAIKGWSTGLKMPSGKGRRLIIIHIESEDRFVLNVKENRRLSRRDECEMRYTKSGLAGFLKIWNQDLSSKLAVDELALIRGMTILRFPPYHCELNKIELFWAKVKGNVTRENRLFQLANVLGHLKKALENVTADDRRNSPRPAAKDLVDRETE
ncbi:hypothetical protein NQ317_016493 [Molorchus minor]|uniref:Transposase n=1 Tax=Molorchus minor TaxID=1323400 RepID=A0ABQ9JFE1_9CUCU|nr:hypothetical protein NQ317_016493 [Molorchus minor]